MAVDLSEIESSELEYPTSRSKALAHAGFGMLLVKFRGRDPSRKSVNISKLVWSLRSDDESVVICAINEYKPVNENAVTVIGEIDGITFVKPNAADELSTILDIWPAEAHMITFFRPYDLQKLPSMLSSRPVERTRMVGFEEEYLLAFGPSLPTILLADTHNSAEVWGSQHVLKTVGARLKL